MTGTGLLEACGQRIVRRLLPVLALLALVGFGPPVVAQGARQTVSTSAGPAVIEKLAGGLVHPWGIARLPDGRLLVTERAGRLRVLNTDGALSPPLAGTPAVVAVGQGGLLDVALDQIEHRAEPIELGCAHLRVMTFWTRAWAISCRVRITL